MSAIQLSLLGLYNWDASILDGLNLPDGIDRETLKTTLLAETAELELLYQNPDTMKVLIAAWAKSMYRPWERMLLALNEDYNPLHNYDRTEEWTDTGTGSTSRDTTDSDTTSNSGSVTGNVTRKTAGWNPGPGMADSNREDTSSSGSGTETSTRNGTEDVETSTTNVRTGRAYGNIGVTTSATMLKEEVETRQKYNIYDIIVEDFKSRFCLMVY